MGLEHSTPCSATAGSPVSSCVASTGVASLGRFNSAFTSEFGQAVVDLATALEAVLIDECDGTEGITARLRNRASTLLATEADPASNIFADVSAFYDLRSRLVHGANLKESPIGDGHQGTRRPAALLLPATARRATRSGRSSTPGTWSGAGRQTAVERLGHRRIPLSRAQAGQQGLDRVLRRESSFWDCVVPAAHGLRHQ
ncbi:MAG TPA: hypothetical protein VGK18_04890 [Propionicimonas sp.]|jgi:hypothetical protein|uniref:hypothetical protein n=1 Tax=Propionicimonas sp. TaxID=1955623 RepID=UPI002F42E245